MKITGEVHFAQFLLGAQLYIPLFLKLDVGVRLGARSRQIRSYGHFIKNAKFR
jgi:hypothetical protein